MPTPCSIIWTTSADALSLAPTPCSPSTGPGWHTTHKLKVPCNISQLYLPPASPELNPTENIWQHPRQSYLSNRVFRDYDAVVEASSSAWNRLAAEQRRIATICLRSWDRHQSRTMSVVCYSSWDWNPLCVKCVLQMA